MKAQAVSKAAIKIERLMEENRKIRNQVKKLISIFWADPLFICEILRDHNFLPKMKPKNSETLRAIPAVMPLADSCTCTG